MKILLAGGGTAGHINPALAIADFIRERKPGADIRFVGTEKGIENKLVPKAGYPLYKIEVYGFKRELSLKNIKKSFILLRAVRECEKIIREFQPDVVIGTGGYVSGPVLYAATKLGVRTAIHEQNAYPGMTSKLLSRRVDKVLISFDESRRYFHTKTSMALVGNPINEKMLFADRETCRRKLGLDERPYVVSFGGSMGARKLNETVADFIAMHCREGKIQHCHATGKFGWKWMPDRLREAGIDLAAYPQIDMREYIYNMNEVMAAADLIICRAGAITLGELQVMGKPSILIPSPNVTNNHQYYNARALSDAGAAVLIEEKDLTAQRLRQTVDDLLADPRALESMGKRAQSMAILDSVQKIYDELYALMDTRA